MRGSLSALRGSPRALCEIPVGQRSIDSAQGLHIVPVRLLFRLYASHRPNELAAGTCDKTVKSQGNDNAQSHRGAQLRNAGRVGRRLLHDWLSRPELSDFSTMAGGHQVDMPKV